MRIYADSGVRGTVTDLDTGLAVPQVRWVDPEAGELEAYESDVRGQRLVVGGKWQWYRARGRFKFTPREQKVVAGAPKCFKCGGALTLPGDDLCPPCRAKERGQRHKLRVERLASPLLDVKCCECSRLAEWSVSDEVEASPQLAPFNFAGNLPTWFDRAVMVGQRHYCSWHYKPPQLLDSRGEVIKEIDVRLRPAYQ